MALMITAFGSQGLGRCAEFASNTQKPVGASLLAIALDQPPMMLTDRAPSLASQLPQGFWGGQEFGNTQKPVGASLLAIAVDQSPMMLTDRAPSLASQLPQGFGGCPGIW
ncbi:hypothetical protein AB4P93_06430 [Pseudomonas sp. B26140]|uniref:hypothetical protein n=1 Tax=Pseudomonas sp. B26140 TaxID=3235112 RepID=UPI00378468F7